MYRFVNVSRTDPLFPKPPALHAECGRSTTGSCGKLTYPRRVWLAGQPSPLARAWQKLPFGRAKPHGRLQSRSRSRSSLHPSSESWDARHLSECLGADGTNRAISERMYVECTIDFGRGPRWLLPLRRGNYRKLPPTSSSRRPVDRVEVAFRRPLVRGQHTKNWVPTVPMHACT